MRIPHHDIAREALELSPYYSTLLNAPPRFKDFQDGMTKEEYIGYLGDDVDQSQHMNHTRALTKLFMDHHNRQAPTFSPRDLGIMQLAAQTHDWAEAVVGDIPAPKKTAADGKRESEVYGYIFDELLPIFPEFKEPCKDVIFDKTSRLGRAFNTVEHLGYLMTGLRAGAVSSALPTESPHRQPLRALADAVVPENLMIISKEPTPVYRGVLRALIRNHDVVKL